MRVFLVFFAGLLFSFSLSFSQPVTGRYSAELQHIDSAVLSFQKEWQIPGIGVATSKDGGLIYARGFGYADTAKQDTVKPTSMFRIADISKAITAITILKLAEENRLPLDTIVFGEKGLLNDLIYSSIPDKRITTITVRQLLYHTAGWDPRLGDPLVVPVKIAKKMNEPPPADQKLIIRYMLLEPLAYEPGTTFNYSNFGYCVLGRVIEKVMNMSYEKAVQRITLSRMSLRDMRISRSQPEKKYPDEVVYYDMPFDQAIYYLDTTKIVPFSYGGLPIEIMDSGNGWIASPSDLIRISNYNDGLPGIRNDMLSTPAIKAMSIPDSLSKSGYGMGWKIDSLGWYATGALLGGSAGFLCRYNNGITFTILCNKVPHYSNDPQGQKFLSAFEALLPPEIKKVKSWPKTKLIIN